MSETLKQPERPSLIYKCAEEMEGCVAEYLIPEDGELTIGFSVQEGYEGYKENSENNIFMLEYQKHQDGEIEFIIQEFLNKTDDTKPNSFLYGSDNQLMGISFGPPNHGKKLNGTYLTYDRDLEKGDDAFSLRGKVIFKDSEQLGPRFEYDAHGAAEAMVDSSGNIWVDLKENIATISDIKVKVSKKKSPDFFNKIVQDMIGEGNDITMIEEMAKVTDNQLVYHYTNG